MKKIIKESLAKLEDDSIPYERSIRWELGSCWVQYLQKKENPTIKNPEDVDMVEESVKGLGKQFKLLKKRDKKEENEGSELLEINNCKSKVEPELKSVISEEAFARLKETGTGLHLKVLDCFGNF